ncbi:prolyl 3-hydroxylase OGFOD1 [Microplitis demolitor]|uniref:prolyl 3-hydroxylase OGFOD1 n=1 Tax=Microplitis demolitor TaxID=69319 RepID=UPI0004CD0E0C|nr:prolyl 3-hydroxylase OGFOD1 [Microplitis demolitor]XP_053594517.1 prolyl 3-hydroxylase OGFOD1 [Microplitis demolitor]
MDNEEPVLKKPRQSILSNHVESVELQEIFRKHWSNHMSFKADNLEIVAEPFRVCKISNFIKSEQFMEDLKSELSEVQSKRILLDLYQLEQTSDLGNHLVDSIEVFHRTFRTDMVSWMEKNTDIELNSTISMTGSCYYDTDYLLCHDDNMGDRKIAFIFYLMSNWSESDGGTLDLFDTDERGLPRKIVRSLVPEYNSLVFFEVSNHSYHQVAEITSNLSRWSINGWFHGPKVDNLPPRPQIEYKWLIPIDNDQDLTAWITDTYLCPGIVAGIKEDVEKQSYAYIAQFLKAEVYEKLSKEIADDSIKWNKLGPANLRNYEVADETTLPGTLKKLYKLFRSLSFFQLLKNYTELDLMPDGENMKPRMTIELQRWSKGCYTLICDNYCDEDVDEEQINGAGVDTADGDADGVAADEDTADENHDNDEADDDKTNVNSSRGNDKLQRQCNDFKIMKIDLDTKTKNDKKDKLISDDNDDADNENDDDGFDDDKVLRSILKYKKPKVDKQDESEEASCSKSEDFSKRSPPLHPDSEDPDVSDIGDYLSGSSRCSDEDHEDNGDEIDDYDDSNIEPGTLDVIMQFNTMHLSESETIDYLDPKEQDSALIHIAPQDNHLCLVYKELSTCRLHKYVNHYFEGYYYNLICTYRE